MAVVTPTDRHKSVRICFVIEGFGGVFVLFLDFFLFSDGIGLFAIGLSQISSFLSMHIKGSSNLISEYFNKT